MEKLKLHTKDFTDENIAKIAELFPNCVTESKDEKTGALKRSIDFDQLRQELSDHIVDGPQERYHLNWPGKREALLAANAPIAKTLRPCREESVDFDTTKNLFIEGDNLDALKLLQETYLGKVKMIYIDPPYNTGNDFIYEDDFAESSEEFLARSNQKDDEGNRLVANTESNGRFHSDWLNMMYSRLKLARNLLREDGVIFVSIDDVEMQNALKILCEIFGTENFVANFIWKSRQTTDSRKSNKVSTDHEYIVCFAKKFETFAMLGKNIDQSKYSNPDNDPRGPWASENLTVQATKDQRPNQFYEIIDPATGIAYPANPLRVWAKSKPVVDKLIGERKILFPTDPNGRPREKKFLFELKSEKTGFSTWLDSKSVGYTTNGTKDLSKIFTERFFNFPKPVQLLETLITQCSASDDIILDFFAGSGSTANAVLRLNAKSGESNNLRKYILVQLPEPCENNSEAFKAGYKTIAEIGKERIRRAGKKIKEEAGLLGSNLDIGFRVLKIDSSNMNDVYYRPDELDQVNLFDKVNNIKEDRTEEDLLFQVLLDWGVDLTLPIVRESISGKTVFFVDETALAACFEKGVNEELIKELAKRKPLRAVFRDNGFENDAVKINAEQIFKQFSPGTDVKVI